MHDRQQRHVTDAVGISDRRGHGPLVRLAAVRRPGTGIHVRVRVRVRRPDERRQRGRGPMGEDVPGADLHALAAGPAGHRDRQDAVAAEREDLAERALPIVARAAHRCPVDGGRRQRVPVDLAVGGQRQFVEHHERVGHHRRRQRGGHRRPQRVQVE